MTQGKSQHDIATCAVLDIHNVGVQAAYLQAALLLPDLQQLLLDLGLVCSIITCCGNFHLGMTHLQS